MSEGQPLCVQFRRTIVFEEQKAVIFFTVQPISAPNLCVYRTQPNLEQRVVFASNSGFAFSSDTFFNIESIKKLKNHV